VLRFLYFLGWGETVLLVHRPLLRLLYQPQLIDDDDDDDDDDNERGAADGMRIGKGNRSIPLRKQCLCMSPTSRFIVNLFHGCQRIK
jgi:hypothetical protein